MVQVDMAWAYGLGSSFAVAAQHHLAQRARNRWRDGFLSWPFVQLGVVIVIFPIATNVQLLWAFPSWQTMHAAEEPMNHWMLPLITTSLALLAVLGYGITLQLIRTKRSYAAFLQFIAGYLLLFVGITYGWDGTGYQRMLSVTRADFQAWDWSKASTWSQSEIAKLFNIHMALFLPVLFYLPSYWIKHDRENRVSQLKIIGLLALTILGVVLGSALLITLCLTNLGMPWNFALVVLLLALVAHPRRGLLKRMHAAIFPPVGAAAPKCGKMPEPAALMADHSHPVLEIEH